ncbi:hypothetical protein [Streptomyces sp. NPDC050564]|uniref:hypothetical protein n=1 Tax=Streptomyces sp. NPDC050564 TaxID=3365631 RepID=UPI0037AC40BA
MDTATTTPTLTHARESALAHGQATTVSNPRDGEVILAVAEDRARIEEITAGDPLVTADVCAYRITEFVATKTAPALEPYRETLG